jgi:hypothetical protein
MMLTNLLKKVQGTNHPALFFNQFEIEKPYWICEDQEELAVDKESSVILDGSYDFKFQNRHNQTPIVGLERHSNKEGSVRYLTRIKHPFRAIVPGQVFFYFLRLSRKYVYSFCFF